MLTLFLDINNFGNLNVNLWLVSSDTFNLLYGDTLTGTRIVAQMNN